MKWGGLLANELSLRLKLIAVVIPLILFMFGWVGLNGYGSNTQHALLPLFLAIIITWLAVAISQLFSRNESQLRNIIILCTYYLLATAYALLITGFNSAVVAAWAYLSLVTYTMYGFRGFTLGSWVLVLIATLDIALEDYVFSDIVAVYSNVILMLLLASAAVLIYSSNQPKNKQATLDTNEHLQHERLVTIINNLSDAVIVTDQFGKVSLYNAATLNLLDTNQSIEGQSVSVLFSLHTAEQQSVNLFNEIKKVHSVTVNDGLRMTQNDEELRLEFTYAPIRGSYKQGEANSNGYILIVRDVTRIKSLEEERDEFISVVSHELRTPVTVTEGSISNAQLMLARGSEDTSRLADSLEEAHDQVIYLARMINDLSTLSRAERGVAAEAESIDVAAMAHDLFNEYSPEAEKQGLHLNLELGTKLGLVSTSRLYLHELLQNFITNSIKYTREGSVTLKIRASKGTVHFAVSDTGIGISRGDQKKIFQKFYRSEDYRTRETGGTGLGLYVATKLAKKIGTTIKLSSRLNHGSTFSIELPQAKEK